MHASSPTATERCEPPARLRFVDGPLDAFLARALASEEEVGAMLLGRLDGETACVLALWPLANVASAPTQRFEACPLAFARTEREAEASGLRLFGFAHSHPRGDAIPSAADRATAWPDNMLVLAAPTATSGARLRAYWRDRDGLREVPIDGARGGMA